MEVYKAINAVQSDLSRVGITKDRTNKQGEGYKFRGIDDVYNSIAPLLSKYNLCILPRILSRQLSERLSRSGGALFYVTVEAEFDFVSSIDGSKHVVKTFGEAMDSGDKATNKAMSAAYKYACLQAFSIPTEGDNDADNTTHDVKPKQATEPSLWERLDDKTRADLSAIVIDVKNHLNSPEYAANVMISANLSETHRKAVWSQFTAEQKEVLKPHFKKD